MMVDTRIILSGLWVALLLTYQQGDLMRIYAGDFTEGEVMGRQLTQGMWLGAAIVFFAIPVAMVFLSLTLNYPVNRWANIILPIFFFGLNLMGLPTYPGAYDRFLIILGLVFNALTVWYAWKWVA